MRSMEQPRRSRAERILGSSSVKDGRFVTRIRILVPDTSVLPEQASRGGAIGGVGATTMCDPRAQSQLSELFSGTRHAVSAPTPQS